MPVEKIETNKNTPSLRRIALYGPIYLHAIPCERIM